LRTYFYNMTINTDKHHFCWSLFFLLFLNVSIVIVLL
jgi:hypothetical protein